LRLLINSKEKLFISNSSKENEVGNEIFDVVHNTHLTGETFLVAVLKIIEKSTTD
jgi:hypothetical protein